MAEENITTGTLLQRIIKTSSITRFMKHYGEQMAQRPFSAFVNELCKDRNTVPERIIKSAGIERTYGHQIFNGRKLPSRDKVIQLAFGFEMTFDEAQKLLRAAHKSLLYPKLDRDAVFIYALKNRLSIDDVQATLDELGFPALGSEKKHG